MANFVDAFNFTHKREGYWQNDPNDKGNAANGCGTYRGIASSKHPTWKGWSIVGAEIAKLPPQPKYDTKAYYAWVKKLNAALGANAELQELVLSFYKELFWDVNKLDELRSQGAANHVYDHSVSRGVGTAAILFQKTVGVLADGRIGPVTLRAANKFKDNELEALFRKARKLDYQRLVEKNPNLAQYKDTWLARC